MYSCCTKWAPPAVVSRRHTVFARIRARGWISNPESGNAMVYLPLLISCMNCATVTCMCCLRGASTRRNRIFSYSYFVMSNVSLPLSLHIPHMGSVAYLHVLQHIISPYGEMVLNPDSFHCAYLDLRHSSQMAYPVRSC